MSSVPFEAEAVFGICDPLGSLLHLGGALGYATLAPSLVARGGRERAVRRSLGLFAAACVVALIASALFHGAPRGSALRASLLQLDYAAVFVLIAGTLSAVHVLTLDGWERTRALWAMWALTAATIGIKLFFLDALQGLPGVTLYVGLAAAGLVLGRRRRDRQPSSLSAIACGGGVYAVGAAFYVLRWPVLIPRVAGPHELFHAFVLIGIGIHWWALGRLAQERTTPSPTVETKARWAF